MNALDLFTKVGDSYEFKTQKGMRFLFVGRSGSGKSNAVVSFPEKIYDFDFDNRFRGAASAISWLGAEKFSKIDFDFYNPKDGFAAVDKKLNEIANNQERRNNPYATLAFESVSTLLTTLALDSQRLREGKGRTRGVVGFLHPDDYNYVSTAMRLLMYNYIFPLNEMGVNVIFSAWPVDKWARPKDAAEYAPPEVVGEKIIGPGNAVEELIGYFDEVYYFRKKPSLLPGKPPNFTVEFNGGFAKSAFSLKPGEHDITGKNFFSFWEESVKNAVKGVV